MSPCQDWHMHWVYSGLNNQQCGVSTTWQMSVVHLLGFIVRDSCLSAYGKSMDFYPAWTTTGAVSHCWARKYPRKPRRTLKPQFHVSGVLMASHWEPYYANPLQLMCVDLLFVCAYSFLVGTKRINKLCFLFGSTHLGYWLFHRQKARCKCKQ